MVLSARCAIEFICITLLPAFAGSKPFSFCAGRDARSCGTHLMQHARNEPPWRGSLRNIQLICIPHQRMPRTV